MRATPSKLTKSLRCSLVVSGLLFGGVSCIQTFDVESFECSISDNNWEKCNSKMLTYSESHYFVERGHLEASREYSVAFNNGVGINVIIAVDHPESDEVFIRMGIENRSPEPVVIEPDCLELVAIQSASASDLILRPKRIVIEIEDDETVTEPESAISSTASTTASRTLDPGKSALIKSDVKRISAKAYVFRFTVRRAGESQLLMWRSPMKKS